MAGWKARDVEERDAAKAVKQAIKDAEKAEALIDGDAGRHRFPSLTLPAGDHDIVLRRVGEADAIGANDTIARRLRVLPTPPALVVHWLAARPGLAAFLLWDKTSVRTGSRRGLPLSTGESLTEGLLIKPVGTAADP